MPAIYGQPMIMAGFSGESGGDEPVVNYVARLDGVGQYWSTQLVQTVGNQDWSVEVFGTFSPNGFYLTATKTSEDGRILVTSSGVFFVNQSNAGTSTAAFQAMTDGNYHAVKFAKIGSSLVINVDGVSFTLTGNVSFEVLRFDSIGSQWSGSTGVPYFSGVIKSVSVVVGSAEVLRADLTDREAGATQQAEIGEALTMANYSSDVWEVDTSAN